MKKENISTDNKLENQTVNLFDVLAALDRKDYTYYEKLNETQKKSINFYMLLHWMSAIKGNKDVQSYYLQSVDYHANKYMFNEEIQKHPNLQWLMLCSASPGMGKQFHQWIPHIKDRVAKLHEKPKNTDIKEYFKKIYPNTTDDDINSMSQLYIDKHQKKMYIAKAFPDLKFDEIELLSDLITYDDIKNYEEECGN